jgi:hypothetical protein
VSYREVHVVEAAGLGPGSTPEKTLSTSQQRHLKTKKGGKDTSPDEPLLAAAKFPVYNSRRLMRSSL